MRQPPLIAGLPWNQTSLLNRMAGGDCAHNPIDANVSAGACCFSKIENTAIDMNRSSEFENFLHLINSGRLEEAKQSAALVDAGGDRYCSQYLQDFILDQFLFRGAREKFFLDIGAHDGLSLSNTAFFEKERGWKGVCVEANPDVFAKLAVNRSCTCVNVCVSDTDGSTEFLKVSGYAEMLSGATSKYDSRHLERIKQETEAYGGSCEVIPVQSATVSQLLSREGISEVHYLSLDIEGGEIDILRTAPFDHVMFHAVTVECNYIEHAREMLSLLNAAGFDLWTKVACDLIFVNRSSNFATSS